MKFTKVGLDRLLTEIADLPSEWMDDEARRLVAEIPVTVERLRAIGPHVVVEDLERLLADHAMMLDILRLLAGEGQEPMAHRICDAFGGKRRGWDSLRTLARKQPREMAEALVAIGMPALIRIRCGAIGLSTTCSWTDTSSVVDEPSPVRAVDAASKMKSKPFSRGFPFPSRPGSHSPVPAASPLNVTSPSPRARSR